MDIRIDVENEELKFSIDYQCEDAFDIEFRNKENTITIINLNMGFLFEIRNEFDEIIQSGAYQEKCEGCSFWNKEEGCMSHSGCHKEMETIYNDFYKQQYDKYFNQIAKCNQIFGWIKGTINHEGKVNWKDEYKTIYNKLKEILEVSEDE